MNILNTMKLKESVYSAAEYKVYDYIVKHPEAVEKNTITRLADLAQTSTSAVLRFCHIIGFKGYKDFRFEMINELKNKVNDTINDPFDSLVSKYLQTINQFKDINKTQLTKFINAIKNHQKIYIFGFYYSALPAQLLSMGLRDLGIPSYVSTNYVEAGHYTNIINKNDLVILFTINGSVTDIKRYMSSYIDEIADHSYIITLNEKSSLINIFHHSIILPGYTLANQSVIDIQSIFTLFVEIVLNEIHQYQ